MKHLPTATPGTTTYADYYKRRRKDEIDFYNTYGYTLTHKQEGPNSMDNRIYTPVNNYGADWKKEGAKAVNQSSNNYIKKRSDAIIKDDKNLRLEIEKFNELNNDVILRSSKLNEKLENLGTVTSASPAETIANYNSIIGELTT